MRAFLTGLLSGSFSFDKLSRQNAQRRYALHLKNPATGEYFPEDLPTQSGTPCDKLYELYGALLINPPIVDALNDAYARSVAEEKAENLPFAAGSFSRSLEAFRISDPEENRGLGTLSLFDLVTLYKLSLPKADYDEPQFLLLAETLLDTLFDNIRAHEEPADAALRFVGAIRAQLDRFFQNLAILEQSVPGIADDSLIRIYRNTAAEALVRMDKRAEAAEVTERFAPLLERV